MKKREMLEMIVVNPAWGGSKDIDFLMENYTKEQVKDAYNMLDLAEEEHFESIGNIILYK